MQLKNRTLRMPEESRILEGKLIESLEVKELGSLAAEYSELGLDSILNDGIAKDIPLIGTLISLTKVGLNIRDRQYIKKIVTFLSEIGKTTQEQREAFIGKYCTDTKRFEEAVMLILEQADAMEKSCLIGKVFRACILGKISYQDALALSAIINKALWQDIENMLQRKFTTEMKMRLCNCGLLNLVLIRRTIEDHIKKPPEIQETVDGFGYNENQYFIFLEMIAKES